MKNGGILTRVYVLLLEALREDSANGTLGRMRHSELLSPAAGYIHDDIATIGVIDLLLDFGAAGVPTAFDLDYLHDEDGNLTAGLVLSIIIHENHVNTVRVLEEMGLPVN